MILKDTATLLVLFIVSLFCAWNITTVEINSGVHLLKSYIREVPFYFQWSWSFLLIWSWSWSCKQRCWSWSCYFGLGLGLKNLVLFTSLVHYCDKRCTTKNSPRHGWTALQEVVYSRVIQNVLTIFWYLQFMLRISTRQSEFTVIKLFFLIYACRHTTQTKTPLSDAVFCL